MISTRHKERGGYASLVETAGGFAGVVASDRGLLELFMPEASRSREELLAQIYFFYPGVSGENELTRRAAALLGRYFAGEPVRFDLPVDDRSFTPFQREVFRIVAQIPYGRVKSYGEVAAEAGSPRAARGVGSAMASNPLPVIIPCHRVVGSSGKLTGYSAPGGVVTKKSLLCLEGVAMGRGDRALFPENDSKL